MIQYINKIPTKIEFFEMLKVEYKEHKINVSKISEELENTLTAVCVYNGDRLIGMGRVKKEKQYLCIEDLIVNSEPLKEEIQKNIIIQLLKQVNQMKYSDVTVRDCLNSNVRNFDSYKNVDNNYDNYQYSQNANANVGA